MTATNVRHLRRVGPPLASYLRVGHRDAALLAKLLDQGLPVGSGVIIDPAARDRTVDLRGVALENGVEAIVDTKSVELSTIGGFAASSVASLAWARGEPDTVRSLAGADGEAAIRAIADEVVALGATGVLAPTHFLDVDRAWLDVDAQLVEQLRIRLDAMGVGSVVIYYPIVASLRVLRDPAMMAAIKASLRTLIARRDVDGIFLRVQGFGTTKAGSRNVRTYLQICRQLHELGVPLVGERTGTIGVALAAFGAVGGVESSITHGDSYDGRRLLKPPSGRGFVPPPRVYIDSAMLMADKAEAAQLLARRGFGRLGCQRSCCQTGRHAMVGDPRRHFVVTRAGELGRLSGVPEDDRAEQYLTTMLAPARDNAAQLARALPKLASHRDRLDDWFLALQRTLGEDQAATHSMALAPTGRRLARGA